MAESYRGLTIRIGGDTTKLTQALHAANQAVAGTASDLKRLNAAMKLDPGNFEAATLQVGALASQASNTAAKIVQLRTAMQQTGELRFKDVDGEVKSVEEMADAFRDVRMEAALAMEAYNGVTSSIAEIDTSVTKLVQKATELRSVDLKEALTFDRASLESAGLDVEKIRDAFARLPEYVKVSEAEIANYINKMVELKKQFDEATRVSDKNNILKEMNELGSTIADFEMPEFNFEKSTNDVENIRTALEQLAKDDSLDESMRMSQEQIDATCDKLNNLKDTWVDAQARMEVTRTVAQFADLRAETVKTEASMSDFLDKLVKASSTSTVAKGLGETTKQIAELDERYKSAEQSIKSINEALKSDPKNVELLAAKSRAVADAQQLAAEKAELLRQKINAYQSDKVKKLADDTKELASQITITTGNFRNAASALSTYEAMIAAVTQRMGKLESNDETNTDEYKELTEQMGLLKAAADRAKESLKAAMAAMQEPLQASELRELNAELEMTQVNAQHLGETNATPKIDEAAFMQSVNMIANAMRRLSGEIISSSDTIDSAYRDMRKTVNGTETEFEGLLDAAIKFSQTSITSADTMLEMQALGGQLGVLTKDLEQFGRITSSLDIATDMDAEDIALRLGQIGNVLTLDIDGMQGFSDALVRLGNNMPAQESAIMNVAQRLSAVASTANFSGSEILAWSAAIASTGQRSEAAATAISNTISGIESAVVEGGDALQAFASVAGRTADDFKKIWEEDPTQALKEFLNGLQTISTSGESAVAALENMGITGVRQQQTLLGLSKTVETLDKALVISEDAWNGVSDQWGDAGDAAVEAAKKSEGFSGALAILKNNASNLAASLGDGLIEPMRYAAEIMRYFTDVLNSMPAPMKTAIVSIGGIATVVGTVVPVLAQFSKGWTAAAQMAVNAGGPIGALISSLTGLEGATTAATAAAGGLSIGMTALASVGIAAFVVAIGMAISKIAEYHEHQKKLEEATTGLTSAMSNASTAYESYTSGADSAKMSTQELVDEVNVLIDKQAELAGLMRGEWGEIGTDSAALDAYVSTIERLSESSTLTNDQVAELSAAVEGFNEITGAGIEVVKGINGELSLGVDEIGKYADAWKSSQEYAQALEDYQNATKLLAAEQEKLQGIEEQLANTTVTTGMVVDAAGHTYGSSAVAVSQLNTEANKLRSLMASNESVIASATSTMGSMSSQISTLQGAIGRAGYDMKDFANVTAQQWAFIVSAYGINVAKAIEYLNTLGIAQSNVTSGMKSLTPSVPTVSGGGSSKSDSAARKAQQRVNDAAYREQQKAYDKEYKALQKALNKKYNEEKKSLDAIYKERKKQYDAQLKQLKDAQDDEVDAFKKATDSKLKEMEREYKTRLKQLEEEYGFGDIDAQIEALEAETEAEKRALEERKQQEKVADLKAAVDKAKSRRKRAEAEKALNDYLEEINVKHNEQTRKDQIEALKKQKEDRKAEFDARKEELKEQYDAEVEAYKESRAEQLEALKEANQAEYDLQKEKYDTLLEQLKERQTEQLEALKESQTAQLEALKEAQQDALQAMKDAQQDALDALSEGAGAGVGILEEAEDDALEDLAEANAKAREEMDAAIPGIKDKFKELVGNVAEETAKLPINMQDHAKEGTKNLRDELGNAIEPTRTSAGKLRDEIDSKIGKLPSIFDTHARNATSSLRNDIDSAIQPTGRSASDLVNAINSPFELMPNAIDLSAITAMMLLASGISNGGSDAERNAETVASNIERPFSGIGSGSYSWGYDFLVNFNNGLVSVWNNSLFPNIQNIANTITSWLGHSVPDEGPLRNDDEWGADFVMNLVNGMHDKESDLYKQVKRMAEIVEDGFDPEMSLDAAYEAVNGIRSKADRQSRMAAAAAGTTINLNMSLDVSNVSVRSEQDIDRLADEISKRMAAAAARQLAGRL